MTEDDRPAFAEAMHALGETFNEPVSDVRAEAYFDALAEFSIEQISIAARLAIRSARFFPKPVELRELIAGRPDDGADAAWAAVLKEIRRVGYMGTPALEPRALRAVNELWGGWRRLCETLPAEGPELVGWIKQFKSTYQGIDRADEAQRLTTETAHPTVLAFIRAEQQRLQ